MAPDYGLFPLISGCGFDTWPPLKTAKCTVLQISAKSSNAQLNYCDYACFSARFSEEGICGLIFPELSRPNSPKFGENIGNHWRFKKLLKIEVLDLFLYFETNTNQRRLWWKIGSEFRTLQTCKMRNRDRKISEWHCN